MTNQLVGDYYQKIIEDVIASSKDDFATSGVPDECLRELQQEWQVKLSARSVAQMPWDPKPEPPAPVVHAPSASNGLPPSAYATYDTPPANGGRVKDEPVANHQYNGMPNGYAQPGPPPQGGAARAQQLIQQQYGAAASASLNAMQRGGGGLALPGQPQQTKPQGLHLPPQASPTQQQYSMQQQQHAAMQRQQQQQPQPQQNLPQQQQQQQGQSQQPRIKMESTSPQLNQGAFQPLPNYSQTDGADDPHEQWQEMLAQRRAINIEQGQHADRMMRDLVAQGAADYQSGLMLPLGELPSNKRLKRTAVASSLATPSSIPQLDGVDDDVKKVDNDDDDENAINSDLDDPDEDPGIIGEDNDDEGDTILCTYDKVQRVKNKWKCTLKDGVMSVNGKEWVFIKGTGEFEW